ncbi:MAG TPA: transposase [Longimicrobiaceae bacterium]|nr:transposase [Longimicrobiaceae bacterium]
MANLWGVKYLVGRRILERVVFDPYFSILDSMPVPICRFSRAKRSRLFAGQASYGKDSLQPGTYYSFRLHVRICWPGVITGFELSAANGADVTAAADLLEQVRGWALGDQAYASKELK